MIACGQGEHIYAQQSIRCNFLPCLGHRMKTVQPVKQALIAFNKLI